MLAAKMALPVAKNIAKNVIRKKGLKNGLLDSFLLKEPDPPYSMYSILFATIGALLVWIVLDVTNDVARPILIIISVILFILSIIFLCLKLKG